MSQVPAGWFNDPYGRFQQRYWDGFAWTQHVATNGVQSVDPMGASPVVPFATPATAYTTPAGSGSDPSPAARATVTGFLDSLGTGARERHRPSLRRAVAGLGGAVLAFGALVAVAGDDPARGVFIVAGLVFMAVAWAARQFVAVDEVRAASVGVLLVGITSFGVASTVSDGRSGFLTGLVLAVLFVGAWAAPGFRGNNLVLGLGAISLIAAFGSLTDSTDEFGSDNLPRGVTENLGTQGAIYLLAAAVLLGLTWWLDRRGYLGTGTALAAAGLLSALVGASLLADEFGKSSGPVLVCIVGVAICVVGSHGARRATTWWGAALFAGGLVAFIAIQVEPDGPGEAGVVGIVSGLLLIGAPLLGTVIRHSLSGNAVAEEPADGS